MAVLIGGGDPSYDIHNCISVHPYALVDVFRVDDDCNDFYLEIYSHESSDHWHLFVPNSFDKIPLME